MSRRLGRRRAARVEQSIPVVARIRVATRGNPPYGSRARRYVPVRSKFGASRERRLTVLLRAALVAPIGSLAPDFAELLASHRAAVLRTVSIPAHLLRSP